MHECVCMCVHVCVCVWVNVHACSNDSKLVTTYTVQIPSGRVSLIIARIAYVITNEPNSFESRWN